MDEPPKHTAEQEKPDTRDFIYIKFENRQSQHMPLEVRLRLPFEGVMTVRGLEGGSGGLDAYFFLA